LALKKIAVRDSFNKRRTMSDVDVAFTVVGFRISMPLKFQNYAGLLLRRLSLPGERVEFLFFLTRIRLLNLAPSVSTGSRDK
jgi:hypothetical protein